MFKQTKAAALGPAMGAFLAASLTAVPAAAQNLTGTWSCGYSTKSTYDRSSTALQFQTIVYGNGQFQAQGVSSVVGEQASGSGQFHFQASGTWRVEQGATGSVFAMQGTMTTPIGIPQNFAFASVITGPNAMVFEGTYAGHINRSSCWR